MVRLLFITMFYILSTTHVLALGGYKCVVKEGKKLNDFGELDSEGIIHLYIGEEFTVDKSTGRMNGVQINWGGDTTPTVIDPGSAGQPYQVITIWKPNIAVEYLSIQEWRESEEKPFIFLSMSSVITGLCTNY